MPKPKTYFVRVKPYNKKRGFLVRNYLYRGFRFTLQWKEVSAAMAAELGELTQPHDEDGEIPLFDVMTKEEAIEVEEEEREVSHKKGKRVVTKAERIPDSKFRPDPRPQLDEESGEIIEAASEAGETVEEETVEPAPKVKPKSRGRTRSRR